MSYTSSAYTVILPNTFNIPYLYIGWEFNTLVGATSTQLEFLELQIFGKDDIANAYSNVCIKTDSNIVINNILNISESVGTGAGPNTGSIILDHANDGGASSIIFRSKVNRGSDYGYIQYRDNTGSGENAKLTIGIQNDADDDIELYSSGRVYIYSPLNVSGTLNLANTINFGYNVAKVDGAAGTIGYGNYATDELCIVGGANANASANNRNIRMWDNVTIQNNLNVSTNINADGRIRNKGYNQPLIYSFNFVVPDNTGNQNAIYIQYKGYSNVIIHISGPTNRYGVFSATGIQSGVSFAPSYIVNYGALDYYVFYFTSQWSGGTVVWISRSTLGQVYNIVEYWY
jgi:hypothetical protein